MPGHPRRDIDWFVIIICVALVVVCLGGALVCSGLPPTASP